MKSQKVFLVLTLIVASLWFLNSAETDLKSASEHRKTSAYEGWLFDDPGFNFQAIRTLSETYGEAADIGEALYVVKNIKNADINSWKEEWIKRADYVYSDALKYKADNNIFTAQTAFLRASNYYRTGSFYMTSEEERSASIEFRKKAIECFLEYIKGKDFIKPVKIPYKDTFLPGYFIKSSYLKDGKAPLLIVDNGFDGTKEETCYQTGFYGARAGYNVLVLDGPGQGETIYNQNLFFRYDWEKVITPAIDFGLTQPEVDKDKIAIYGISMGGYLIPRAAAFDDRIKACVANGGVFDFYEPLARNFPKDFLEMAETDSDRFNEQIAAIDKKIVESNWFMQNGMWTFNVQTPAEFMIALKKYDLTGIAEKIRCNTLIINGAEDTFMKGQPEKLYKALKCEKTYMFFDNESAGELHCQLGALAISNERIYSWLNNALDYYPYSNKN